MAFAIVDIIYIIANFMSMMTVRKIMHYFFDMSGKAFAAENAGYAVYCIFLNISYFLHLNTFLCAAGFFASILLITACSEDNLIRKICVAVYIFGLTFCFDKIFRIIFYPIWPLFSLPSSEAVWAAIAGKIALWIFVRFLTETKRRGTVSKMLSENCELFLAAAPVLSCGLFAVILSRESSSFCTVTGAVCILSVNLSAFLLYQNTDGFYRERMKRRILAQQARRSVEQLDLMSSTVESLRIFRHDIINHFMVLQYHIERGHTGESLDYLKKMKMICQSRQKIRTGNAVADSLLNYKLEEAERRNIRVEYEIDISDSLPVENFDLTCILGNLMDNAVEAAERAEKRRITFRMEYRDRGFFLFEIRNTYAGKIIINDNTLLTTKRNAQEHGLGLKSVSWAIRKYNGSMRFLHSEGMFGVSVRLFF